MNKKYKTILIDPPWKYGKWGVGSKKSAFKSKYNQEPKSIEYETLTTEQIRNIDIKSLASENCELYLWTTQKYLPFSFDIIKSWGFKYCQTLAWCKAPMGKGQGGIYCPTTEFLILARVGKAPKVKREDSTWWRVKRTGRHSQKPVFFHELIEKVTEEPRLEMFARAKREGWDVWGNEVNSDIYFEI